MSLHEEDQRLSRILAALAGAGDIVYDWDAAGDAIVWHGPVDAVLGTAGAAALSGGRALIGRINPEDLPLRQHRLSELRDGEAFDVEYRLRAEDGGFSWVQDRGQVVL